MIQVEKEWRPEAFGFVDIIKKPMSREELSWNQEKWTRTQAQHARFETKKNHSIYVQGGFEGQMSQEMWLGLGMKSKKIFVTSLIFILRCGENYRKPKVQTLPHSWWPIFCSCHCALEYSALRAFPRRELCPMLPEHLAHLHPGGVFKVTGSQSLVCPTWGHSQTVKDTLRPV